MDQVKIGRFIAACRKEAGYTQGRLAERLGITDRAVSKWETGRSMPDVSLMPQLCDCLHIDVNELLTGERLKMEDYREQAEKNLMELSRMEEENNRRLLTLENVIGYTCSGAFLIMIFAAGFGVENNAWRIVLVAGGAALLAVGAGFALKLEHDAGYYECPNCGRRYVPDMKSLILAPHKFRDRKMKCRYCGKRGYHKKVLTASKEDERQA